MPAVVLTVWTERRKWMGNLLPLLFWLPPTTYGVYWMAKNGQIVGLGLWCLIAASILGWLAVNFLGLWQNRRMRRQLARILDAKGEKVMDSPFVGIATPSYSSLLDPHEDVGFLKFEPGRLIFLSETRRLELNRPGLKRVNFRANVHTLLGLGRWVCIEGEIEGKPIRLQVEPREKPTLLANMLYSKSLMQRIQRWLKEDHERSEPIEA
jgi:hypothetical protein